MTSVLLGLYDYNRQSGQNASDDVKSKDFRRELEDRERDSERGSRGPSSSYSSSKRGSSSSASSSRSETPSVTKKSRLELPSTELNEADADRDEVIDDSSSSSEESDDEDDTSELLAELNRIKKERAAEEAKKEAERKAHEDRIRMENILSGNPLIGANAKTDFKVKRRWDDDVVFKNCARNEPDKSKPSFINDTLRSEFHKKFMEKYVK